VGHGRFGLLPVWWSRVVGFHAAQPIGAQHGETRLPAGVRRKVLDLVEAGRPIAEVAKALGFQTSRSTAGAAKTASIRVSNRA
jgi:hypothetical protein